MGLNGYVSHFYWATTCVGGGSAPPPTEGGPSVVAEWKDPSTGRSLLIPSDDLDYKSEY